MEYQIQQNLNITHYSITIREMQIKTANEVLLYISHNDHHQKSTNNAGEDVEKRDPSRTLVGM